MMEIPNAVYVEEMGVTTISDRRFALKVACLFVPALFLVSLCPLVAADQQAVSCYRLDLQGPPTWISSGATWDKERQRFLVVDPVSDQVVAYNLQGERQTISQLDRGLRPVKIARSSDGFVVEVANGSMLSFDRRFAMTGGRNNAKLSPPDDASLYQWVSDGSGGLVAFAAVGRGNAQHGFFRVQKNSKLQLLLEAEDELQKNFYLLGYPYIADLAGETFFVSMSARPALYRVRNGKAEKLNDLPGKYGIRPQLRTSMTGAPSAVLRFAELETFSMPAGLYAAQDGFLYLLTREPAGEGKTKWLLHQIEAKTGNFLGWVRLPTSANHLTVIPTPDRGWLFIEKGKVVLTADKKHHANDKLGPLVVISNDAIRSLSPVTSCPVGGGIIWADEKHRRPLFIPQALLASGMALPLKFSLQDHLDLRLLGRPRGASTCDYLEPSIGQGTLPDASDLKDLVTSSPVAVVGKIVRTEPGWDVRLRHVVTKVHLEVTVPLKGTFTIGSKIDFLSPGGSMRLADKDLCTTPRKEFYQPRVGDEVVVSAEPSVANPRLLESPYVFPLSEGKVQPEPYPDLLPEQKPILLSTLLASANI